MTSGTNEMRSVRGSRVERLKAEPRYLSQVIRKERGETFRIANQKDVEEGNKTGQEANRNRLEIETRDPLTQLYQARG